MTTLGGEAPWLGRVDRWTREYRWLSDALLALALAAVLGALSISGAQNSDWSTPWAVILVVCFTTLHLTVTVRTRAPDLAYAVAAAAMLVIVLAPDGQVVDPAQGGPDRVPALFLPSSFVFLVVLYAAAAGLSAVRGRIVLAVALAGTVIASTSISDALGQVAPSGWLLVFYVGGGMMGAVLLTWNLGRLARLRKQRERIERAESERLAALEERTRIAREMHDIVAHSLAVVVRQAEGGAFVAEGDPDRAGQTLQTIADTARGALVDMRGLLAVLRDPADGPGDGPRPALADLPHLVAGVRATGLDVEFTQVGEAFPLGAATELAAYRLVQEGLTNAVKYAGPRAHVAVELRWSGDELTVQVTDDGEGVGVPVPGSGVGLGGLRARVDAAGGAFASGRLDRGFRVAARFARPRAEVRP